MTEEGRLRADGSAFCIAHRLRFDPQLNVGCVLCQRASLAGVPEPVRVRDRGVLVALLLGVWAGVLVAFALELAPLLLRRPTAGDASAGLVGHAHALPRRRIEPASSEPADDEPAAAPSSYVPAPPLPPGAPAAGLSGAAVRGDLNALATELAAHAAIDAQDGAGRSALLWAILGNRPDAARVLIEQGARVDLASYDARTPLMWAAERGLESVASSLLTRGAAASEADRRGATALMAAARGDHRGVVESLLVAHAAIDMRDDQGRSALAHAALAGASSATIDLLLDHGAQLEGRDVHGATPLALAVQAGKQRAIDALLARGASRAALEQGAAALGAATQTRSGAPPVLDSPATVALLEPEDRRPDLARVLAEHTLLGYRGWTRVPAIKARVSLRGVTVYGKQQATLVGRGDGDGSFRVEDVLLLEVMENGQRVDMAFVGRVDGIEVDHQPVRRLGDRRSEHFPGEVDLTPFLSVDGRELVLTALTSWGPGAMTELHLRVNGQGARRTVGSAEVDRAPQGGPL